MANELITREDIVRGKQNFDAFDQYLDGGADEKVRLPSGKSIKTRAAVEQELFDKFSDDKAGMRDVGSDVGQVAITTNNGVAKTGFGARHPRRLPVDIINLSLLSDNSLYVIEQVDLSRLKDAPVSERAFLMNLSYSDSKYAFQVFYSIESGSVYYRTVTNVGSSAVSSPWASSYHSRNKLPYTKTTADPANVVVTGNGELQRTTSSRVFKDRIKNLDIEDYRTLLKSVQPVSYHSKNTSDDPDRIWYSFIAEDLVKVDPQLVQLSPVEFYEDIDAEGKTFVNSRELPEGELAPSGLNLNGIVTMLTRINQYMLDDIEALEAEKTQLKSRMTKLEKRLESLEKQFASE